MKFRFENADALLSGIALVAPDLGIEIADTADLTVTVTEVPGRTLTVTLDGSAAAISYGDGKARFFRGLAILTDWVKSGKTAATVTENPLFASNGAMVDMSRNGVMNVKTVKTMLRRMALMGMNTYMLYTEDTYEIEEHPFFGYMRGRYTKAELKELDAYALTLGIELIPCVQMLGHLATHLRWEAAGKYKDTANAMLVGSDHTYKLIDDMLKVISECFTTRRLHMGMDETHDLGTGRYLDIHGYRERQDIYFEHLAKIAEMARSYGFKPMMWSDMFFRLAGKNLKNYAEYDMRTEFSEEVLAKVPKGIQQVFWDYYKPNEEFYAVNIDKHNAVFGDDTIFAGGVWTWSSHCPLFSRSLNHTIPALEACRKKGVREVFATIWHNGAECNLILGLAGLAWYADYDYKGGYDPETVKQTFAMSCGASYDDLMLCELPEHPDGGLVSLTRAFLYNDPMVGLVDKHLEGLETREYYRSVSARLAAAPKDQGIFTPAFDTIIRLTSLLENKADFGVRLKAAYDAKNTAALAGLAAECDVIIEKTKALRASHKASWMEYSKPFGWEVFDIRYGGIICRFETAKERILAYLAGDLEIIEELEAERLRLDGKPAATEPRFAGKFLWMQYQTYATASRV